MLQRYLIQGRIRKVIKIKALVFVCYLILKIPLFNNGCVLVVVVVSSDKKKKKDR